MDAFNADVIVAGAGPSGLMLAGELRLSGLSVIVLDRLEQPMQQSRALGFSARTIEEFGQRGLLEDFGPLETIPGGHFGGLPIDYRIVEGGNFGVRGVPQSRTEAIINKWAVGLGADVRRGHEVIGLTQDENGVQVEVAGPAGVETLRAAYVVGCDGARSTVRHLAGIDFPGVSATIEMKMADVAGVQLRLRPTGEVGEAGMVVVLPLGPGATRVVVFERGAGVRPTQEPPTFEEVAAAFQRVTGEDISGAKQLWTSYFTDASRHAAEYRKGRVFLAGDAAHIHLPIGAQGISAGVGDVVNLGWKLAAAVKGHAPRACSTPTTPSATRSAPASSTTPWSSAPSTSAAPRPSRCATCSPSWSRSRTYDVTSSAWSPAWTSPTAPSRAVTRCSAAGCPTRNCWSATRRRARTSCCTRAARSSSTCTTTRRCARPRPPGPTASTSSPPPGPTPPPRPPTSSYAPTATSPGSAPTVPRTA